MTAWSVASYINSIAESGKAVYDLPMYLNVWLMGKGWWPLAGESYPSGGGVTKVLDIHKWFTPSVDMVAPDAHVAESKAYEAVCTAYARDDNPFFYAGNRSCRKLSCLEHVPRIADYNSLGDFFFGVERVIAEDGSARPECQMVVDSVRCAAAVIPLLLKYQGTGKVHAVIQEDLSSSD